MGHFFLHTRNLFALTTTSGIVDLWPITAILHIPADHEQFDFVVIPFDAQGRLPVTLLTRLKQSKPLTYYIGQKPIKSTFYKFK